MIQNKEFVKELKDENIKNCYIFCGNDENLIKENIELIKNKILGQSFIDLNYIEFYGEKVNEDQILNACETLPFMNERKIVSIYRSEFLEDGNNKGDSEKVYKFLQKYIPSIPSHCILIMYYIFKSNRDKPSYKVKKLENISTLVRVDKLKGKDLINKVKKIFEKKGQQIGNAELIYFCNEVENNLDIIENEVEKLCSFVDGKEISKEDIYMLIPEKSENDIFNLVDAISRNDIKNSLEILNELIFRGEKESFILYMIERQYKLLLDVKMRVLKGYSKEKVWSELKINPYVCEKLIYQCKNYSQKYIEIMLEQCLETEKRMKTLSLNLKTEMEMLIVKGAVINKNA